MHIRNPIISGNTRKYAHKELNNIRKYQEKGTKINSRILENIRKYAHKELKNIRKYQEICS